MDAPVAYCWTKLKPPPLKNGWAIKKAEHRVGFGSGGNPPPATVFCANRRLGRAFSHELEPVVGLVSVFAEVKPFRFFLWSYP
jgi:hypothetical protein